MYLGARTEGKAQEAIDHLKSAGLGSGEVHYLQVDLGDVTRAKVAAEEFLKKETRLDILSESGDTLHNYRSYELNNRRHHSQ